MAYMFARVILMARSAEWTTLLRAFTSSLLQLPIQMVMILLKVLSIVQV